jgi:SAM-dependent methyltransferase
MLPKAEVNFTTSTGDKDSPGFPPIVPLMPEMLLINATCQCFGPKFSREDKIKEQGSRYKAQARFKVQDVKCGSSFKDSKLETCVFSCALFLEPCAFSRVSLIKFCVMPTIGSRPWYKDWFNSPFFHKLYFERDEAEAKKFLENLIEFLQPPPGSRILDTACGRGQICQRLVEMEFEVTGIDLAINSIHHAKELEGSSGNPQFYQHDMRFLFRTNYFDYVFNFFTSFGYFETNREHDDAMRTFSAALKPGGILVIDYLNFHYVEDHLVHHEIKNISGTSFEINRWDDDSHFYKKIHINDVSLHTPEEYTEKIVKLTLGDFTDMLGFQNMQVMEVFGNYNLSPYDLRKTPRMIIVAKKKDNNQPSEKEKRLYSDGRNTDGLT